MSTIALPMTSSASAKRSYDVADLSCVNLKEENRQETPIMSKSVSSLNGHMDSSAQAQLLPSVESSTSTIPPSTSIVPPSSAIQKPAKKAKLGASEKEAKRLEKEAKDFQKAEEKARKDMEKAKRDAEKAVKDAEKALKEEEKKKAKEIKEEQTKLKEEEKQRKEDEKMKKARSQLRLNAFFRQPSNPDGSPTDSPPKPQTTINGPSPVTSRRSSVSEMNAIESERRSRSVSVSGTPSKPRLSDYRRRFPEFFVQSHTRLAPQNRFYPDPESLSLARERIDGILLKANGTQPHSRQGSSNLRLMTKKCNRLPRTLSMKEAINSISNSSAAVVDLTDTTPIEANPRGVLKTIPVKFLKFAEDVRPPYIGTYTKPPTRGSISSLARNPLGHVRPDTNYGYDSEAEWEDPVDGEDLNSEGEEEEEDEDEEEMEGFLDDEEPNAIKRRPLLGDQEPTCSGICWEGESHSSNGRLISDLRQYRIDVLLENPCLPIDPFSTTYWTVPQPEKTSNARLPGYQGTQMEPPRIPLSPINRTNTLLKPPTTISNTNKAPTATKRFVDPDVLDEFKEAIVGSDLTKMGLCEILKKRFPKQKKDAIKDTLDAVAERVGEKVADKKWVLRSGG